MRVLPKSKRIALRRVFAPLGIAKAPLTWAVVTGVATFVYAVGFATVSVWLITRAPQTPLVASLALATTIIRTFGASRPAFRYLRQLISHSVTFCGMSNLWSAVYSKLADSCIDRVTWIHRGDLLTRMGRDIDAVDDLAMRALPPTAVMIFASATSMAVVAFFSPATALTLACCLAMAGLIGPYASVRGVRLAEIQQVEGRAELVAFSLTMLESSDELRVSGRMGAFVSALDDAERRIFTNRDTAAGPGTLSSAVETLATGYAVLTALVVGGDKMADGALTPVELTIVTLVPLAAFEAVGPLGEAAVQLVRSAAVSKRILDLLDSARADDSSESTPTNSDASVDFTKPNAAAHRTAGNFATPSPAKVEPVAESLVAKGLVTGWPGGPKLSAPVDLVVEHGSPLAVVGPSGVGKTTLLYTLTGMLEPKAGSVLLDGRPVHLIPHAGVLVSSTLTAKSVHLLETSILESLRMTRRDVSEEEAAELLIKAGLRPWLTGLPDGVHTILSTDVTTVSSGERKQLLFIRALVPPADCLLVDKPAEHLGGEAAGALVRGLASTEGRTVILASHRLTALEGVDSVAILDRAGGKACVLAQGAHDELAASLPVYRWSLSREESKR